MSEKKRKMLLVVFGTVVASFVLFTFLFTTYELLFNKADAVLFDCKSNSECHYSGEDCSNPGSSYCECKGPSTPGPYVLYICWPKTRQ